MGKENEIFPFGVEKLFFTLPVFSLQPQNKHNTNKNIKRLLNSIEMLKTVKWVLKILEGQMTSKNPKIQRVGA